MEGFRFEHPVFLYFLILVPFLAFVHLFLSGRRRKALEQFGNPILLEQLMPSVSYKRPVIKFYVLLLVLIFLILAMSGPQFGSKPQTVKRQGIEIMIALDVSNSMNAQDIAPSRLERAKLGVTRLIEQLANDRVGIVVFAGNAYTQMPITVDYASAKMYLNTINTNIVPMQGTVIAEAINLSIASFSEQEDISRAIIVITDGENHEANAVEAAKQAAAQGIKVYTVGMGSTQGAPIPTKSGRANDFIKDRGGSIVISKLDEATLQQVAIAGGGAYIPANNIRSGVNALIEELADMQKSLIEDKVYSDYKEQFQYFAGIALLLILVEFLILDRKNKRFRNVNIFSNK